MKREHFGDENTTFSREGGFRLIKQMWLKISNVSNLV